MPQSKYPASNKVLPYNRNSPVKLAMFIWDAFTAEHIRTILETIGTPRERWEKVKSKEMLVNILQHQYMKKIGAPEKIWEAYHQLQEEMRAKGREKVNQ